MFITTSEAGLLKQIILSCSVRCDIICYNRFYEFGHNLMCYLGLTQMLSKPQDNSFGSKLRLRPYQLFIRPVSSYNFCASHNIMCTCKCKFNGYPYSIKTPDGRTYLRSKLDHYIQREKTTILNKTRQLIAVICAPFWQLIKLH